MTGVSFAEGWGKICTMRYCSTNYEPIYLHDILNTAKKGTDISINTHVIQFSMTYPNKI
jgi:hypothetical protein